MIFGGFKDFLTYKGNENIYGSKDTVRQAFQYGIIEEGEIWMDMIGSRNRTSHTYDKEVADEIVNTILYDYFEEFKKLESYLSGLKSQDI
ncbi:hypothetical protein HNV12_05200 [Methanococcoides sp. SA1]|nr:hypothetical protein [Methanococcoides sp. SA1]